MKCVVGGELLLTKILYLIIIVINEVPISTCARHCFTGRRNVLGIASLVRSGAV